MKNVSWAVAILFFCFVTYAIGSSCRADIDADALAKAQTAIDDVGHTLRATGSADDKGKGAPAAKSVADSVGLLEAEVSKLGTESQKGVILSVRRLKRALADSKESETKSLEMFLDRSNTAAVAIRSVKSSLRQLQVTRNSPTFVESLGRDIRTLVSRFTALGAFTLVAICVIIYAVFTDRGRNHVKSLIVSVSTLKVGSLELTFKGSGREATVIQIANLSKEVTANLLGHSTNHQLLQKLAKVLEDDSVVAALGKRCSADSIKDFRAVIHVPDPLLSRTFFQITSYWPLTSDLAKRAGRRRSVHFGAIGRAWTEMGKVSIAENVEGSLVTNYNMDPDEARDRKERSYAVICLPSDGPTARALLYMDSSEREQFPESVKSFAEAIQSAASGHGLSESIERIYQEMNCASPIIKIHEDADAAL